MGNQSFFSPKNKTRTWAFLLAHLHHSPKRKCGGSGEVQYCTVLGCAMQKFLYNSTFSSCYLFLDFASFSNPNFRLTFQYLAPFSTFGLVFRFQLAFFQYFRLFECFSYSVLLDLSLAQGLGWHVSWWLNGFSVSCFFFFVF